MRHGYDARVAEVPLPVLAGLGLPAEALKLAQVMVQVSVLGSAPVQEPVQGLEPALAELPAEALALTEGRSAEELAEKPPAEGSAAAG